MKKSISRTFIGDIAKAAAVIGSIACGISLLSSLSPAAINERLQTSSGITVDMVYRALQPGEPVLFILKPEPSVIRIHITFMGRTVDLNDGKEGGGHPAFLGIDLGVEPGLYPLEMLVERRGGESEAYRRDLEILGREFPSQTLKVSQEYVTPPLERRERIRRESEIIGWIFEKTTDEWLGEGNFRAPHTAQAWPNFGQRRITNGTLSSIHTGVDLRVPYGDPIRSVNAGRVVLASSFYMPGKTVIIDHGRGIFSFYCHLSRILVRRGSLVRNGDIIGECGSTGRSTGPHLHWSMRIYESRVDPYALLELSLDE